MQIRGLRHLIVPGKTQDAASDFPITTRANTNVTQTVSGNGFGRVAPTYSASSGSGVSYQFSSMRFWRPRAWTVIAVYKSTGTNASGTQTVIGTTYDGTTVPVYLGIDSASAAAGASVYHGGWSASGVNTDTRNDGLWHACAGVFKVGSRLEFWLDGRLDASVTPTSDPSNDVNANNIDIGCYDGIPGFLVGNIAMLACFDIPLVSTDLAVLTRTPSSPFVLLRKYGRPSYMAGGFPAAAGFNAAWNVGANEVHAGASLH